MGLNKAQGNMYGFISHTYNTVKGACPHDCTFCYMKRWGHLKPVRFDEKELKTDLGSGNSIFVGSSCDMFAKEIPEDWILRTIDHCYKYEYQNNFLFQTKNPKNIRRIFPAKTTICVSLESNRHYKEILRNSPSPMERVEQMQLIRQPLFITVEPVLKFDTKELVEMIKSCNPVQVNIGSDSQHHNLPEPTKEELIELVSELEKFTRVIQKSNLKRIWK